MDAFDSIAGSLDRASALGGSAGAGLRGVMPPPPGSGGKFKFAPDEIRAIVKAWEELADGYRESMRLSERATVVSGPGQEYASERHAMTASASFSSYFDSVRLKHDYCVEQAVKFQQALDSYQKTDEAGKIKLRHRGDEMPQINDQPTSRSTTGGI
ncbi:hypothetical protein SAMN05192558_106341 [Actinokineospora alba]|uniref:PE family protein n=1 Tax=Actinokineospora alba TaxID=504798 RepID=A0A1H0Q004_9PSEU|nr:hypothetical protein [Actinokineospora alba]TDP66013.1 hypothetical protein C8E96_1508 [Actinokineospora alba]SDI60072.1 hypothetical protein SAMN05421871_106111 [Actinokineospora alba]SDP10693.1 hypothetical protein SAMN05192558_106341 [Actinokineospora alba]